MAARHPERLLHQEDLAGHLKKWLLRLEPPRRPLQEKKVLPKHKLFWGAPQVVRIKWECTVATAIFKREYPIDYVNIDSSGRRNCQCNLVLIVQ